MKYEFKGTPGLWNTTGTLNFIDGPDGHNEDYEGRHSICEVFGPDAKANQMLIASAPLLLSALIKAVEDIDESNNAIDVRTSNGLSSDVLQYPDWYAEAKSAIEAALNLKTVEK